ncbi:MAG: aminopeptidase N [Cellvibrionaceae bacterium]|nr:aminopeptidase N [Cellvibrionaceae bacterium]
MKDAQPQAIYLADYQAPPFLISHTELLVDLGEQLTTVTATLHLKRNPAANSSLKTAEPLVLHGQALTLVSVAIDGRLLPETDYQVDSESLRLQVPDKCQLSCVTQIKPQENTACEGLYQSGGIYCTQCEAEGFRKITYYLDRPDVMSEFTTTIIADKARYPVLLSNGNLIEQGEVDNRRHWAKWHDPFKKPAYLFALVAGQLAYKEDSFTTRSGRAVVLRIYLETTHLEAGNLATSRLDTTAVKANALDKCDHAMAALKRAMAWDEQVYGREYDLDIFMIVAVDDFNMGAMENKGLNIFNTACVLADPQTTTDIDFQRVESVVAHEYFHNWSGNRVTCRDWFQLSLKEGFTVFRDQAFSADMGSKVVKRVEDVTQLRTAQFAEDAGPMAHPVQPGSFIEIANFYTLTIYEKGAEIVRMLHSLLGAALFRQGSDLYFSRYDGQAVTIDDFIDVMMQVSGRDLLPFKQWYRQAGTPVLTVNDAYNEDSREYTLTIKQHVPDTPEAKGQDKPPLHIPVAMGLVGEAGSLPLHLKHQADTDSQDNTHCVLELTEAEHRFVFTDVPERPVPSLLRNFSAPVRINARYTRDDFLRLLRCDSDGFNRWDASQQLAVSISNELVQAYQQQQTLRIDSRIITGFSELLEEPTIDPGILALMLTLPSEKYLGEMAKLIDVQAIYQARTALKQQIAEALHEKFWALYQSLQGPAADKSLSYDMTAAAMARRSLKNTLLDYLLQLELPHYQQACVQQYQQAGNMTDRLAAFRLLIHTQHRALAEAGEQALTDFYCRWQQDNLVINQWLSVQASIPQASTLARVKKLMTHDCFSIKNPNKVRALIGTFCHNAMAFHQASGEAYQFLVEQVSVLNDLNPQIAARLVTPLTQWKKYLPEQQRLMKQALEDIVAIDDLSKDVYEVTTKSL